MAGRSVHSVWYLRPETLVLFLTLSDRTLFFCSPPDSASATDMESMLRRQLSDRSLPGETTYAYSVTGGAGGHGTRISSTTMGSWSGRRYSGSGHDYHSVTGTGNLAIGNEKATMQHLNDRLASYLETVKKLEKENHSLEIKIKEVIDKKGPLEGKDYSKYNATITELRAKVSLTCTY